MISTLVARDWAEIQERMLVPLYEAVYDRLGVGPGTRLLGLDCGAGLALLLGAARGARVTGAERDPDRLALARERGLEVAAGLPEGTRAGDGYDMLTALCPGLPDGPPGDPGAAALAAAVPLVRRGGAVVLAGWGPADRCAVADLLGGERRSVPGPGLEGAAVAAGLRPEGSWRVFCPFGYADMDSAVRGLLSSGLYRPSDPAQAEKELTESLHPYAREDGSVWLPNVFRYVLARVP
ncbi:methyltransferase type 11 [Streptomyces sp. NPDC097619]|uniref:methyltransferase type 11 n=1 Tax=Streptomyces sp. NPDC097619 TaxID=3157228 RepID=UPI0033334DC4